MKKFRMGKIALCVTAASAFVILISVKTPIVKTATLNMETGVAGIEVLLDEYYSATVEENINLRAAAMNEDVQLETTSLEGDAEPARTEMPEVSATPVPTAEPDVQPTQEPVSEYANVGISIANPYVYVREKADKESEAQGKLYKGCAATILKTEGDWVQIKSGNVKGYIKSEYLAIGFDAEELVDKYGTKLATIKTQTLKVREEKSTESKVLDLIAGGETYEVVKEFKEWVKIRLDEDASGFVSKEYTDISVEFEHAISIEEEQEQLRREEEARQAELEQLARLEKQKQASANNSRSSSSNKNTSNNSSSGQTNNNKSGESSSSRDDGGSTVSGSGAEIAAYAQKFVGNPYVYGGTSLTNGADCSGFTQSVYKHFGISIGRSSRDQVYNGRTVSVNEMKPGDLLFYKNSSGRISHVAMYIGGGQVVHASTARTGIKISPYNYRNPYRVRRIVE